MNRYSGIHARDAGCTHEDEQGRAGPGGICPPLGRRLAAGLLRHRRPDLEHPGWKDPAHSRGAGEDD